MLETQFLNTPETMEEALRSPQQDEIWKLVKKQKSLDDKRVKLLTTKWVFCIKRDENGNILRYKARLVIHGCKQRFRVDYCDTYSLVVRIVTMLLVLLIASLLGLERSLKDVEQPAYFNDGRYRVCLLLKEFYGLKQAARFWYQTLHTRLVQIGFRRCAYDVGLYVKYIDGRIVLVMVYVDDIMVIRKPGDIDAVIEELRQTNCDEGPRTCKTLALHGNTL
ncbi:putative transposable element [Phytophthora palmivora]|uniref:Transposable element n=1 Tax=Phytophthora palmivora TaxID=4796 RepID=A0A2P4YDS5_9STRA|nr:putative transposable element [Phytophthora palmivora]